MRGYSQIMQYFLVLVQWFSNCETTFLCLIVGGGGGDLQFMTMSGTCYVRARSGLLIAPPIFHYSGVKSSEVHGGVQLQ